MNKTTILAIFFISLIIFGFSLSLGLLDQLLLILNFTISEMPVTQFFIYQYDPNGLKIRLPNGTRVQGRGIKDALIEVWNSEDTPPLTWDRKNSRTVQRFWTTTDQYGLNWFGFPFSVQLNRIWHWKVTIDGKVYQGSVEIPEEADLTIWICIEKDRGLTHLYPERLLPEEPPEEPQPIEKPEGYFEINGIKFEEITQPLNLTLTPEATLQIKYIPLRHYDRLDKVEVSIKRYGETHPIAKKTMYEIPTTGRTELMASFTFRETGMYTATATIYWIGGDPYNAMTLTINATAPPEEQPPEEPEQPEEPEEPPPPPVEPEDGENDPLRLLLLWLKDPRHLFGITFIILGIIGLAVTITKKK